MLSSRTPFSQAPNIVAFEHPASILGDPGTVSRAGRNGATKLFIPCLKTAWLSSRFFSRPDWLPLCLRGCLHSKTADEYFSPWLCACAYVHVQSSSLVSNPDASADVRNTLFRRLCWSELVLCFHVLTFSLESLLWTGPRVLDPGKWLSDVEMHCRYFNLYA